MSLGFLQAALQALPAEVLAAASAAEAMRWAADAAPSLCLIDAHLPDASGIELLRRLRADGVAAPALAHTAETAERLHTELRAAGFLAVLVKPIAVDTLHRHVRAALRGHGSNDTSDDARGIARSAHDPAALPIWDDRAALRALNGNAAIVAGMRTLFRNELVQSAPKISALCAAGEIELARAELHKLKAASAFVGATQLAASVQALAANADDTAAQAAFTAASERLLRSS